MDITLTMRQQKRIEIIERALRNDLTVVEAAMVLGVSERQCYRIKARVRDQGVKGVLHGNRGRPCKYKLKDQTIKRVVELARGKYRGFNDHHLTEKLKEEEKIEINREKGAGCFVLMGLAHRESVAPTSTAAAGREERPRA